MHNARWPFALRHASLQPSAAPGCQERPTMAHHTVLTPSMERCRQLADIALTKPEGITASFRTDTFGSLSAAKSAAVSFQSAFSSLRTRTRNRARSLEERKHIDLGMNTLGPYDKLACNKRELPNGEGYYLHIAPSYALDFAMDVRDAQTGELLPEFTPKNQRLELVVKVWFNAAAEAKRLHIPFRNPWSAEDEEWVFREFPDMGEDLFKNMRLKRGEVETPHEDVDAKPDLADINLSDIDWGT